MIYRLVKARGILRRTAEEERELSPTNATRWQLDLSRPSDNLATANDPAVCTAESPLPLSSRAYPGNFITAPAVCTLLSVVHWH